MPHFVQIGGALRDKLYVQIPDGVWSGLDQLTQKQITEAVEKGYISDKPAE